MSAEVPFLANLIEFVPGAVGGCLNVLVGQPMDLIKVRQQSASTATNSTTSSSSTNASRRAVAATLLNANTNTSTAGMLRSIVLQDGVTGLYRGVTSPLLAVTPAFAVSFWSCDLAKSFIVDYEHSKGNFARDKDNLSIAQVSLAGGFSGIPLACVVGPSELIKIRMQVGPTKYNGFSDCIRQLYREGGLASIFRGTGSTMMRDVPGNAAYFSAYEFVKRQLCALEGRDTPSTPAILFAGGMAGVANWIVAIPFDTIKSRYQSAPAGKYLNLADVLRQTVQYEGVTALFRGLTPALLRAFPANAACLLGVETARSFFAELR